MSRVFESAAEIADAIVASVGQEVVLGLPIGIGKAVRVVDALYERAKNDPSISLTIFTGLTLSPPQGKMGLESRFIGPIVDRLYADWPTPAYVGAIILFLFLLFPVATGDASSHCTLSVAAT